ncbi:MAG: DUF167 domain-containing protein [Candidatus Aminicenantes bacterium]|nr:DUF167 domain-containing protein [Candidatus Aminicenantes bacterium]
MKEKNKIYLNVQVHPRAKKRGIEKKGSHEYIIRVLSPPSKGKANREVIQIIASYFDVPPSQVNIVRGQKARRKLVILDIKKNPKSQIANPKQIPNSNIKN